MYAQVRPGKEITIETKWGEVFVHVEEANGKPFLVIRSREIPENPIVRLHSSCVFGESLHAVDCDCGAQLAAAIEIIAKEGGIVIYAWEEGRGAGISAKVAAIFLEQTNGLSTDNAFRELGLDPEPRDFSAHIEVLRRACPHENIRLASNNPAKIDALTAAGFKVERFELSIEMTPQRAEYLKRKQDHLGHLK